MRSMKCGKEEKTVKIELIYKRGAYFKVAVVNRVERSAKECQISS